MSGLAGLPPWARQLSEKYYSRTLAVFVLHGNGLFPFLDAFIDSDIQVVDVRNEQAGAYMADAWGAMTGRPGVVAVSAGPGHTNALTGLTNAWWDGRPFDRILADVPCSASGVVRRNPDIKWLRRPDDIAQFAAQQAVMLEALWRLLAPGGTLLYATCSIFHEENDGQVQAFLARHAQDAERCPLPAPLSDGSLLPDAEHDGFFYALLRKI